MQLQSKDESIIILLGENSSEDINFSHSFSIFWGPHSLPPPPLPPNTNLMKRGHKPEKITVVSKMLIMDR